MIYLIYLETSILYSIIDS